MDIYETIMIKENDVTNLNKVTEKLNEGFRIDDRIEVGRSTVLTMRKRVLTEQMNRRAQREYRDVETGGLLEAVTMTEAGGI